MKNAPVLHIHPTVFHFPVWVNKGEHLAFRISPTPPANHRQGGGIWDGLGLQRPRKDEKGDNGKQPNPFKPVSLKRTRYTRADRRVLLTKANEVPSQSTHQSSSAGACPSADLSLVVKWMCASQFKPPYMKAVRTFFPHNKMPWKTHSMG